MNVQVEASASAVYGSLLIVEDGCEDNCAAAIVQLDETYKPSPEMESFLQSSESRICQAKLMVVGRFDQDATPGCFAPRFGILAKNIELKSPVIYGKTLPQGEDLR